MICCRMLRMPQRRISWLICKAPVALCPMSKRRVEETGPVDELQDRIGTLQSELRTIPPESPLANELAKQIGILKAEQREYLASRTAAAREPLKELPVVGAARPMADVEMQAPFNRRRFAPLGGRFASRTNVRAPTGRAAAAVASHAKAAEKLRVARLGRPGKRKSLKNRTTIEVGVTKNGRPKIVQKLDAQHHAMATLGLSTAQRIAAAAAGGASVFANTWNGKGTGVTLSGVVGDELANLNMPSYGQYRNQLSAGLRDNAKFLLVQARAARIAYNKYKNQMWNRRSQKMRLTKYGSKYSHRKAGLREVEVGAPIAV